MKSALLIVSIVFWVNGYSGESHTSSLDYEKRPYGPVYEIVSDQYDSTIAKGVCIIEGLVKDQSGNVLVGAMISTSDKKKKTYTDADGVYMLKVSHKDSSIFMFHKNYGEIIIRSYDFRSRHRVVINFSPVSRSEGEMNVKKPVIYLYSETEQEVELKISHPGMAFMYPAQ
ncbi:MAG: carboxypeptidase regulatory-like domain-containing protein [Crocinitomicaceae bacterium]|nr:carboxypeptidase regulatory-like domain-containing protein [Crocinitomicaceae bacterium]